MVRWAKPFGVRAWNCRDVLDSAGALALWVVFPAARAILIALCVLGDLREALMVLMPTPHELW